MRHICSALLLLFFSASLFAQKKLTYSADLKQLHQNILSEYLDGPLRTDTLQPLCDKLLPNGSWADINYTSQQRGSWPTVLHLSYINTFSRAYQKPGSAFYHNPKMKETILKALNFWLENDFQCPNWWYPEIGVPMQLAPILILMENDLSADQLSKGIKILDRAKIRMTGQNKVWLSGNVLMKSLLLRDAETIKKASQSIQEELKVSLSEGIQPDGSFHQHGPQIQFGNYGLAYVGDMIKWIRILRNTPFYFDESKLTVLRNYLLDGQQWITWKKQMDISACGRQLFQNAQTGKAQSLANNFAQMEKLDPKFADVYNKANQYQTLVGNKHFWRSDFQIQRTADYYFSVKMCSDRVLGAESCNSENIRGYYLGDGATYFYQSGKEYENIFPFWDWKKIPGTTTQQDDKDLPVLTASGYHIPSNFVGGVSDGKSGIAVMDYRRDGVSAKKAWFIFNNQIICLGAGISSSSGAPLTTSVNQSFLNGDVIIKSDSETQLPAEASVTISPRWILHDNTGYFFPESGQLRLENKTVTGSWKRVALMYKDEPINAGIFKLWFEHSLNSTGQTYAYCIVPRANSERMHEMETTPTFKILNNDVSIQSVISGDENLGGVIFYKAGTSKLFGGIETDQPCVLMVKREGSRLSVSISDPTQKLSQIQLRLNGIFQSETKSLRVSSEMDKTLLSIDLPQGYEAGKTVTTYLIHQR
jgi:Polysaccharide lyase family 8, C-terminal beta-sandwich domain./Polysaccharide lyase family 8, N terminal alpha-helical domain./Polysaccharide lyase family 8, super-sandwich domain.